MFYVEEYNNGREEDIVLCIPNRVAQGRSGSREAIVTVRKGAHLNRLLAD